MPLTGGASLPLDFVARTTFREIRSEARQAYIMLGENLETVIPVSSGSHRITGHKEIIVVEADDRLFFAPESDCLLEFLRPGISIRPATAPNFSAVWGITFHVSATIPDKPSVADLFDCISSLCQVPGEESVLRSHPFFRRPLRICRQQDEAPARTWGDYRSGIILSLPGDLRYLYAAAPLAYYLGACIKPGKAPALRIAGNQIPLPEGAHKFEQWACSTLQFIFQAECSARYLATTGKELVGADPPASQSISPALLASMGIENRLLTYIRSCQGEPKTRAPWHTASYVDAVPQNIELLSSLMQSLSSVFYPSCRDIAEREVVELEVRQFLDARYRSGEGREGAVRHTILPELGNALIHQWFSNGYPIDAIKQLSTSGSILPSTRLIWQTPRIALVCNENQMLNEAIALRDLLKGEASITLLQNLSPGEMVAIFSDGYDIVHFIGHCDGQGFKCGDEYADLALVKNNTTAVFFFNTCLSYSQGTKLLEKGSTCGIAIHYKIRDEDAFDISLNFYRLLARGYPVLLAYFGAKECYVIGKEYLFLGNGLLTIFGKKSTMPLYWLTNHRCGYSLYCITAGFEKGFIYCADEDQSPGLPDFGVVLEGLPLSLLIDGLPLPKGACLYNGEIYGGIEDAAQSIAEDLRVSSSSSCQDMS